MPDRVERCSDRSRAVGERLAGTAPVVDRWLLVEAPGPWPRDVGSGDGLAAGARATVQEWLACDTERERRRLLFVRRPGRSAPRRLAFVVRAEEAAADVRRMELPDTGDLAGLDLERSAEETNGSLVLVCGHGSRDSCCALRGTAVYDRLAGRLGEEELWISSHHGGHRFAANVLVLPAGIHLGHIEPGEAGEIVASALAGRIELDRYRGRTCYPPPVQAAEHAIRAAHGLTEVSELRLEAFEGSLVSFRDTSGERYAARVREEEGPSVPASCGEPPKPQQTFSVHLV